MGGPISLLIIGVRHSEGPTGNRAHLVQDVRVGVDNVVIERSGKSFGPCAGRARSYWSNWKATLSGRTSRCWQYSSYSVKRGSYETHPAGQISVLLTFILLTTEVREPAFPEQFDEGETSVLLARL